MKNVFALEKHLINYNEWLLHENNIPKEKWDILMDKESGPTGLGYTDETGYYILGTGQGPFVIWMEKEKSI